MPVRPAVESDVPAVVALLCDMHRESDVYSQIPMVEAKLKAFVDQARQHPRQCVLVAENAEGGLDGAYIGFVADYFFSTELGAWDMIFYVRPDKRGTGAARELWQGFRDWARAAGAKHVWPASSTAIDPERTLRFYTGVDLRHVGATFFGRL